MLSDSRTCETNKILEKLVKYAREELYRIWKELYTTRNVPEDFVKNIGYTFTKKLVL